MYLSRIAIDLLNRNTLRALDNLEIMHGIVESCFGEVTERVLWRLDELKGETYLLLLSTSKPDFARLAAQIGKPGNSGEIRDYEPLLKRTVADTTWRFRLKANPVMSVPGKLNHRGKIKAITIAAHQRSWLERQGKNHGFTVVPDQFDVVRSEWHIFRNKGRTISLLGVTFEGVLTITDTELFQKAMKEGIGRGKAYGMGMLTVVSYG